MSLSHNASQVSTARIASVRRFSRHAAWLLDSSIRLPFIGVRIGLQPIISLVPVVGDAIGFLLTLGIIAQATRVKAPPQLLARMAGYAVLDLFVGLVPVVGDAADFVLRANTRNCALLEKHLDSLEGRPAAPAWQRWLGMAAVIGVLGLALWGAWLAGLAIMGALFG